MKDWLRNWLNKDYGVILNCDNCEISNGNKFVTIKIPKESLFDKFSNVVDNDSDSTEHTDKRGKVIYIGKSKMLANKGRGFTVTNKD